MNAILSFIMFIPTMVGLARFDYPDVPAEHWARNAVLNLQELGIMVGYPDGLFRGK